MSDRIGVKLAFVISDLHCGSKHGLMRPGYFMDDGNEVKLNTFQQWMWDQWTEMTQRWLPNIVGDDAFDLIINGDLVEGDHHKTVELIDPDAGKQPSMAMATLRKLNEARQSSGGEAFVVKGTPAHVSTRTEDSIAADLGAMPDPNRQRDAFYRLPLTYHGCTCRFAHHISATTRTALEGTALSIQLTEERARAAKEGRPIPKVAGRAHRHAFGMFHDGCGLSFVTPAWQGMTSFVNKIAPAAELAMVGGALLDWRNEPHGAPPTLRPFLRTQPPLQEIER